MTNLPTVSDTKRAFYRSYARPIYSIYQRVVEELLVEMHLLHVNNRYRYDPIYALGVVQTFDRFMEGYPEAGRLGIFESLMRALNLDPSQVRADAQQVETWVKGESGPRLQAWLEQPGEGMPFDTTDPLQQQFQHLADQPHFKYSRLFAAGLVTILGWVDSRFLAEAETRLQTLKRLCTALHLSEERVQRDLDLYRSNLERLVQARAVLEDVLKAGRKSPVGVMENPSDVAEAPSGSSS